MLEAEDLEDCRRFSKKFSDKISSQCKCRIKED